jgi:hypothetical protein
MHVIVSLFPSTNLPQSTWYANIMGYQNFHDSQSLGTRWMCNNISLATIHQTPSVLHRASKTQIKLLVLVWFVFYFLCDRLLSSHVRYLVLGVTALLQGSSSTWHHRETSESHRDILASAVCVYLINPLRSEHWLEWCIVLSRILSFSHSSSHTLNCYFLLFSFIAMIENVLDSMN